MFPYSSFPSIEYVTNPTILSASYIPTKYFFRGTFYLIFNNDKEFLASLNIDIKYLFNSGNDLNIKDFNNYDDIIKSKDIFWLFIKTRWNFLRNYKQRKFKSKR